MAFAKEIYVDPSIAGNSGTGTSGDPYGDLAYALATDSIDATNPTRINIKSGTAEVLTAVLNFNTNFLGTGNAKQLTVQGFTTTAGDGGRAVIDGATNSVPCINNANMPKFIHFKDIDFSGGNASNPCCQLSDNSSMHNCSITGHTAGLVFNGADSFITQCHIKWGASAGGGIGVHLDATGSSASCTGCYLEALHASCSHGLRIDAGGSYFNIIDLRNVTAASVNGVDFTASNPCFVINNTIIGGSGATCNGIDFMNSGSYGTVIANNYIEGFSGTGSYAMATGATTSPNFYLNNRWYNCTNGFSATHPFELGEGNQSVGSSGLVNLATDDFTPNSNLIGLGYPGSWLNLTGNTNYLDIGAVQVAH